MRLQSGVILLSKTMAQLNNRITKKFYFFVSLILNNFKL